MSEKDYPDAPVIFVADCMTKHNRRHPNHQAIMSRTRKYIALGNCDKDHRRLSSSSGILILITLESSSGGYPRSWCMGPRRSYLP